MELKGIYDAPSKSLYYWKTHFEIPDGNPQDRKYPVQRHSAGPRPLRRVLLQITELTVASHDFWRRRVFGWRTIGQSAAGAGIST